MSSQLVGGSSRSCVSGFPVGAVVILLRTDRPATANTAAAVGANMWRLSTMRALSESTQDPALAGLKWAIDFCR